MTDTSTQQLLDYLATLVNNKQYHDVVITVGLDEKNQKDFYALTHILSRSDVFAAMFTNNMKENQTRRVIITDTTPEVFQCLLEYIYTSRVNIVGDNVIALLYLSQKYNLPALALQCATFISDNITCDSVLLVLETAIFYNETKISEDCLKFVDTHFEEICVTQNFKNISQRCLLEIIQRDSLAVNELVLFNHVVLWCKSNQLPNTTLASRFHPFLDHIRLCLIDTESLVKEVRETGLISDAKYIEALEYQLFPTKFQSNMSKFTLRFAKNLINYFTYQPKDHYTGIIHYIATDGGKVPWKNPHATSKVIVTSSSPDSYRCLNADRGYVEIVERDPLLGQSLGTDNVAGHWVKIDLRIYTVHLQGYRLANTRGGNCHLRNWRMQGSTDNNNWVTLRTHENDTTFTDENKIGYWAIQNPVPNDSYRYFRILQTGLSTGNFYHLSCRSIELFGRLMKI